MILQLIILSLFAQKTICIKYGESVRVTKHFLLELDGNVVSWHTGVRHLCNFFNSCLDINMDTNRKCSHFIGYYNQMMNNFVTQIMRVLLLYLNLIVVLFMAHFYGNITVMVLENDVHNGTNVLEESILFHITHIDGY